MDLNGFSFLLASIIIPIVLFLVGREIVLWYFKVNEVVALLRDIRDRLPEPRPAPTLQRPVPQRPAAPVSGTGA